MESKTVKDERKTHLHTEYRTTLNDMAVCLCWEPTGHNGSPHLLGLLVSWNACTEQPIRWKAQLHDLTSRFMQIQTHIQATSLSCKMRHTQWTQTVYTYSCFTPPLSLYRASMKASVNLLISLTVIFVRCKNIMQACELMPGISAVFKVIYLGETRALNPLMVWRDYTFSWKSTLPAGISGIV